jgi:hypothetical protein
MELALALLEQRAVNLNEESDIYSRGVLIFN